MVIIGMVFFFTYVLIQMICYVAFDRGTLCKWVLDYVLEQSCARVPFDLGGC